MHEIGPVPHEQAETYKRARLGLKRDFGTFWKVIWPILEAA